MVIQLSADQMQLLQAHADARNTTPADALQVLLSAPPPQRRPWTEEELRFLRDPRNSPRDLAVKFKRSVQAVSVRRNQLAREEGITALQRPLPH